MFVIGKPFQECDIMLAYVSDVSRVNVGIQAIVYIFKACLHYFDGEVVHIYDPKCERTKED